MSQIPPEARQTVAADSTASAGQVTPVPSQVSSMSQIPPEPRQTVAADSTASAGQVTLVPSQVSSMSQMPPEARQIVAADSTASEGQVSEVPVQVSWISQAPALPRQTSVDGLKSQVLVQQAPKGASQSSVGSRMPLPQTGPPFHLAAVCCQFVTKGLMLPGSTTESPASPRSPV